MIVFDYIRDCTDEERREIVAIFMDWFRETFHAAALNADYMILERGEIRPPNVMRCIAKFTRDYWYHQFHERAIAHIEGKS